MPGPLLLRLARSVAVVFGVVTLTFLLLRLAPGDPVQRLVGPLASPAAIEAERHALGLDRPLPAQYAEWLVRFARGDWGVSIATGLPARELIARAWPATVRLVGLSIVLSYLLGVLVGAVQAFRPRSRLDTGLSVATVTLFAMPSYWLGLLLVMVFTWRLRLLPAFGDRGLDADFLSPAGRLADAARHLALPLPTLVLIGIGGAARFTRGAMLDVRGTPFVAVARARGVGERQVTVRHVLRNALIPVVTLLGLSLPALFSGAVFVEAIFAWPGVGRVLVSAVQARDYPVVMAATTISATLVVAGNLLADLLLPLVDPRLRQR